MAFGGEGGIRAHCRLAPTPDFESGTFDHSATSPAARIVTETHGLLDENFTLGQTVAMPITRKMACFGRGAALVLSLALAACSQPVPPPEISGELRGGARNNPAPHYITDNDEPARF